jgi:3-dehydroquinate dehydratase-2
MPSILIMNGPNLGKLGQREQSIYGQLTLEEINRHIAEMALISDWTVRTIQSNHEGDLIDAIEKAEQDHDAIIINPGGLGHTSVSLRDAIAASTIPAIEVHISNIAKREEFRQKSLISPVCQGTISGFGHHSYLMALWYIITALTKD